MAVFQSLPIYSIIYYWFEHLEFSINTKGTYFYVQLALNSCVNNDRVLGSNFSASVLVRDVTFVPHKKEKYQAGEEIRCTAKGNPTPKILFEPSTSPGKFMDSSKTITIQKPWEGNEVTLTCTATNSLGSKEHVEARNITISVAGLSQLNVCQIYSRYALI